MMTARSVHRSSLQFIGPSRVVAMLVTLLLAAGMALAVIAPVAAQDDEATAEASPTAEELQTLREQAIEDGVDQLELTFEEFNDSGIEGTATFYDLGEDETLVAIDIDGGGEEHPAYILEGVCGNTEPQPVERLTPVDDSGESLSRIDRSLTSLIDEGDYAIDLRLSPEELGVLIGCANIEGTTVPATPADGTPEDESPTAEPTGAGGQTETQTTTATATATATTEAATETETPTAEPTGAGGTALTPTAEVDAQSGKGDTDQDGTGGANVAPETVASLPLADYSELGVTGTVSLLALDDDTTRIKITLTGDAVTGGHIAHLHPGTCDALSDEGTIYLESVDANGVSETTVGLSLDELLTGGWSINVHQSEDAWGTWLVCGDLGDATGGMTGVLDVTPVVGGKGTAIGGTTATSGKGTTATGGKGTSVGGTGDGTSGVSGKGEPVETSTLTQGVGVGSTLLWPESPAQSVAWALGIFALLLTGTGLMLRHGQRTNRQPSRWQRLGL